jgi:hypothetical protein
MKSKQNNLAYNEHAMEVSIAADIYKNVCAILIREFISQDSIPEKLLENAIKHSKKCAKKVILQRYGEHE